LRRGWQEYDFGECVAVFLLKIKAFPC
jgi:hypothetical protein